MFKVSLSQELQSLPFLAFLDITVVPEISEDDEYGFTAPLLNSIVSFTGDVLSMDQRDVLVSVSEITNLL